MKLFSDHASSKKGLDGNGLTAQDLDACLNGSGGDLVEANDLTYKRLVRELVDSILSAT
jgi:hypothetical protein